MTVNVDQLTTDVIPEPEPAAPTATDSQQTWDALAHAREALSRVIRDRARTSAEAFDD